MMELTFKKRSKESAKAFAAFKVYLELGPERSLGTVAERLGKSKALMERWSRRHAWQARVDAHAAHLAEVERREIEARVVQKAVAWEQLRETQRRAEWDARCRLLKLAEDLLARWEKAKHRIGTPEGIARLIEVAHKLGRLATGMPTDLKESKETVQATLDVNWEAALAKVFRAPERGTVVVGGCACEYDQ